MSVSIAKLPPGPNLPPVVQAIGYLGARKATMKMLAKLYGPTFLVRLPMLGSAVVISEPALIKQLLQTSPDIVRGVEPNLSIVLGPGSMFGLHGDQHHRRRKLLVPPFHGKRMRAYEDMIEEETLREIAAWPRDREFAVMPSTMHITLNAILRAVFGAEGAEFEVLRDIMPEMVNLASRLALLPSLHRDLGAWSPWGRFVRLRREFDGVVQSLIATASADPAFDERDDVLSLMLRARYDDGTPMDHRDIADELFTLLAAGHETTATSLAWAFERLRRHPQMLARLVAEIDAGETDLLQATIHEVQRCRPVIDGAARQVIGDSMSLGEWVIPRGTIVLMSISLAHQNETVYAHAGEFDPERFVDGVPDAYSWIPFGGGSRRCLGAAFANMEMNVVLRTILREYTVLPTTAAGEKWHSRGVAFAPQKGGLIRVQRRGAAPEPA